jgi:hypothetical protein
MTPTHFYTGKEIMVFDSDQWRKNGGDSKTGDDFYRNATIIKVYAEDDGVVESIKLTHPRWRVPQTLIDVRFEETGRISKGHFANDAKEIITRAKG